MRLKLAYDTLCDPTTRSQYDRDLAKVQCRRVAAAAAPCRSCYNVSRVRRPRSPGRRPAPAPAATAAARQRSRATPATRPTRTCTGVDPSRVPAACQEPNCAPPRARQLCSCARLLAQASQ
jgi:hypothetical protein